MSNIPREKRDCPTTILLFRVQTALGTRTHQADDPGLLVQLASLPFIMLANDSTETLPLYSYPCPFADFTEDEQARTPRTLSEGVHRKKPTGPTARPVCSYPSQEGYFEFLPQGNVEIFLKYRDMFRLTTPQVAISGGFVKRSGDAPRLIKSPLNRYVEAR